MQITIRAHSWNIIGRNIGNHPICIVCCANIYRIPKYLKHTGTLVRTSLTKIPRAALQFFLCICITPFTSIAYKIAIVNTSLNHLPLSFTINTKSITCDSIVVRFPAIFGLNIMFIIKIYAICIHRLFTIIVVTACIIGIAIPLIKRLLMYFLSFIDRNAGHF